MNIAENIKRLRKLNNMEQRDLADKLNISNKTVSSWEKGRTEPKMGMIEEMCKIFGCEKSELIDGKASTSDDTIMKYAKILADLPQDKRKNVYEYIDFICREK